MRTLEQQYWDDLQTKAAFLEDQQAIDATNAQQVINQISGQQVMNQAGNQQALLGRSGQAILGRAGQQAAAINADVMKQEYNTRHAQQGDSSVQGFMARQAAKKQAAVDALAAITEEERMKRIRMETPFDRSKALYGAASLAGEG